MLTELGHYGGQGVVLIDSVWLTINRACNFRCPWCYAEGTKYLPGDDMSFEMAKTLIDFAKELGATNVLLIGGEPTYYSHFFDLLEYMNVRGIGSTLVTNGYRFKDMDFVKNVVNARLKVVSFSIKAANAEQHRKLTKTDAFEEIKQAIKNLAAIKTGPKVIYSTVISSHTLDNIEEFAKLVASLDGTRHLTYTMCNPILDSGEKINRSHVPRPSDIVNNLVKKYDTIDHALDGKFSIEQSLPVCIWPDGFIEKLKAKKQVYFGCHLQRRNGLVFDKEGRVIVCNSLPAFFIGQYGTDFTDKGSFEKFWKSKELIELYGKIYEYPSKKCQSCKEYVSQCGGGCPLKWFVYDAKRVIGG